jgi:hypothetical protein
MLRSFADVLSSDEELLLNLEENIDELNNRDVMLKIGPMASGSAVLADSEILEAKISAQGFSSCGDGDLWSLLCSIIFEPSAAIVFFNEVGLRFCGFG